MASTSIQASAMKCLFALAIVSAALGAQGKEISIYQSKDKFSGNTVYFTEQERPNLEGGSFVSMRYVYISFNAVAPVRAPQIAYSINIEANLQDWIFIRDGESMILLVDGQSIPIRSLGSIGDRSVSSLGVKETALYPFSIELLRKLASAQRIEFRVYGTQGNITGEFTPKLMEQLRFFAEKAPGLINDPSAIAMPVPTTALTENPASGQPRQSYEVVGDIHVVNIGTTAFSVSNVPFTAPNYELSTNTQKDKSLKSSLVFGESVSEDEVRSVLEVFYKNTDPGFDSKKIRNLKVGVPTYAVWCSDSATFGCRQKKALAGTLVEYEIDSPMQSGAIEQRKIIQLMRKFSNAAEYH